VTGTYELSGSDLTMTLGASTLLACGDASQDTIYLASLLKVSSYEVENGQLQLMFPDNGGKMDFKNGGNAQQFWIDDDLQYIRRLVPCSMQEKIQVL